MNTIDAIARTLTGAPDVEIPREVRSAINKALHANGRPTLAGRKTVSEVRAYLREEEVAHAPTQEPQQVIAYQGFAHAVPARKAEPTPAPAKVRCHGVNLSASSAHDRCARTGEPNTRLGSREAFLCHSHEEQTGPRATYLAQRARNIAQAEAERAEYLARKEAYAVFADLNA